MTIRYPLATSSWDDEELQAIHRVIASDQYSMGKEVKHFETQFAAWVGSKYAVMANSGSSANLLMVLNVVVVLVLVLNVVVVDVDVLNTVVVLVLVL